ncbi:Hypothetical predicted protein, partial [Pelobates cultripes]
LWAENYDGHNTRQPSTPWGNYLQNGESLGCSPCQRSYRVQWLQGISSSVGLDLGSRRARALLHRSLWSDERS